MVLSEQGLREEHKISREAMREGRFLLKMRRHPMLAKNTAHMMVLKGGLGAMGIGRMWCHVDVREMAPPEWDELPEMEWDGEILA